MRLPCSWQHIIPRSNCWRLQRSLATNLSRRRHRTRSRFARWQTFAMCLSRWAWIDHWCDLHDTPPIFTVPLVWMVRACLNQISSLLTQHAVDLLIELLMNSEGDITLVPTGPLTNIATAIRREPAILPKIQAISLMGGAIGVGNVTPSAEFNLWFDPEAASIVFQCGRPITMVPLEVTHQALATKEIVSRIRATNRPVANFAADLLVFFAESYKNVFGFSAPPVHDPCAVAAVLEPGDYSSC